MVTIAPFYGDDLGDVFFLPTLIQFASEYQWIEFSESCQQPFILDSARIFVQLGNGKYTTIVQHMSFDWDVVVPLSLSKWYQMSFLLSWIEYQEVYGVTV